MNRHRRRPIGIMLFCAGLLAASLGLADDHDVGIRVEKPSQVRNLVPADQLERSARQQFNQMKQEAAKKKVLATDDDPQLIRLRQTAQRMMPFVTRYHSRADRWDWEVQLFKTDAINAFCMPGGKIGFYSGILDRLALNDDEVAMIMGHEIAHALREHARARIAKSQLTGIGAGVLSSLFGLGEAGRTLVDYGAQLTMLKFSRDDEVESDLIGMDLAARAGFDPRAGISLWQKMSSVSASRPPQWLSTHPSGDNRILEIERNLDLVLPLYARAIGISLDQLPAYSVPQRAR